jgi:hypothetical protein
MVSFNNYSTTLPAADFPLFPPFFFGGMSCTELIANDLPQFGCNSERVVEILNNMRIIAKICCFILFKKMHSLVRTVLCCTARFAGARQKSALSKCCRDFTGFPTLLR